MKVVKNLLLLFILLLPVFSQAQVLWEWEKQDNLKEDLILNPVRYTNRAQCAADSDKPTKSAFILLDSVNPGKSFYRMAQRLGGDTERITKEGIEKFRYTTVEMIKIISQKLLSGQLPLLAEDISKITSSKYSQAIKDCRDDKNCSEFYRLSSLIWNGNKLSQIQSLNFKNSDYLAQTDYQLGCYYLKNFSAIQGHLMQDRPSPKSTSLLGETMSKHDEYMVSCTNIDAQKNLKVANYQIDFTNISDKVWNKKGFSFWNSLKIYLSWAMRGANEVEALAVQYTPLVRSINYEETMLFIPNGCKSINKPACDAASLNLNSLRTFAQIKKEKEIFQTTMMNQVGVGVENDIINEPIVDVNDDILDFASQSNANAWAENFRENFTKARGFFKLKFINAINKLRLLKKNLPVRTFLAEFDKSVQKSSNNELIKTQIYYMCSEYIVAGDEKFSFLNDDINILNQDNILDRLSSEIGGEKIQSYFQYYTELKDGLMIKCRELQRNNYWGEGFEVNREGFTSWYKEHTTGEKQPYKTNINRDLLKAITPMIALTPKGERVRSSEVVCVEGANCARHVLNSIVDLYTNLKYADSMLPGSEIKAPNMANPYSERKSCNMYDPWKKKRSTIYQFFYDVARAALFGALPSPVYISTEVKDKQVVSLKSLMEDGKIKFDPKFDQRKIKNAFSADFGSLFGVPCTVSISNSDFNPARYYSFNGISIGACSDESVHNTTVYSASDMNSTSSSRSACFSCALNLKSVIGVASYIEPVTRSAYILIRGTWNLIKGLRDPHDIPRTWSLDANQVHHTYRKYGQVNKFCMKKLLKGNACMGNSCEGAIATNSSKYFKGAIEATYATRFRGNGYVKLNSCEKPIRVWLGGNRSRICQKDSGIKLRDFEIPQGCENIIKEQK